MRKEWEGGSKREKAEREKKKERVGNRTSERGNRWHKLKTLERETRLVTFTHMLTFSAIVGTAAKGVDSHTVGLQLLQDTQAPPCKGFDEEGEEKYKKV